MKREELKKLLGDGADEKVIDAIMALHGADLEAHKNTATKAGDDLKAIQEQLDEAKKQIKSFEDMKPEDLKKAVGEWETKYKDLETKHAEEAKQRDLDTAAEKFVDSLKPKDSLSKNAILSEFRKKEFKLDETGFQGAKEWADAFKAEHAAHFEPADGEEVPAIVAPTKGTTTKTSTFEAALLKGAGLKEWPQE